MGAIRVTEGSKVQIRNDGRVATVLSLTPVKTGNRGRPVTLASLILEDASEMSRPVRDLKRL